MRQGYKEGVISAKMLETYEFEREYKRTFGEERW